MSPVGHLRLQADLHANVTVLHPALYFLRQGQNVVSWLIQSGCWAGGAGSCPLRPPRSAAVLSHTSSLPIPLPLSESASPFAHLFLFSVLPKHSKTNSVFFPSPFSILYLFYSIENASQVSILTVLTDGMPRCGWIWFRGKCKELFRDEFGVGWGAMRKRLCPSGTAAYLKRVV